MAVPLTSSSCSAGRCGSTAADVRRLHSRALIDTRHGGRVASEASPIALSLTSSSRSAGRCANDATGVRLLHCAACSSSRLGGSEASVRVSSLLQLACNTRSWCRCASDAPGRSPLKLRMRMSSTCSDAGRPSARSLTTAVPLQSSDVSAVRWAKLASPLRLRQSRTFSVYSDVGSWRSRSSVIFTQLRCVIPRNAATAGPLASRPSTARSVSHAPTAAGKHVRHRTVSTACVPKSHHGTAATTADTAGCSRRTCRASAVLRQARVWALVTLLPASTRTSSGTSPSPASTAGAAAPPGDGSGGLLPV